MNGRINDKLVYSRINATNYALKYALYPNKEYRYFKLVGDNGGDCANFISQCLHAGGAPMIYNKLNPWWYNKDAWSLSWSVANSLYWYLKTNAKNGRWGPKGIETDSTSALELGDLIFYENKKKEIFHSTIITNFKDNNPLVSQHTPNATNILYQYSWAAYKYHFIKVTL